MTNITGKYHFIGIGGIGMSGLAKLLIRNGCAVTGSDQEETEVVVNLRNMGSDIKIGHSAENVTLPVEAVVISAAIKETNPELKFARDNGCKVYKYAEMLGAIMDQYEGIAVAGTHGKSTTSGWLAQLLTAASLDPNFIVGAEVAQLGDSSGTGTGTAFVAEACEYDRSFLNISPKTAVILNVDLDHLDYYTGIDDIINAFTDFATGTKEGGLVIANGQDANVGVVLKNLPEGLKTQTFGMDWNCDISAHNIDIVDGLYHFDVYQGGELLGRTKISLPGEHNIMNALAVTAAAIAAGATAKGVLELLDGFTGIDRRLMLKAEQDGITVLDDYAHHPTEIRASLGAIRQIYPKKRILCIFQPHQYSRTRFLLDDFAESFKLADMTIVPDIYFVRDTAAMKKEVNSQVLVDRIRENGCQALFIRDFDSICQYLKTIVKTGDLIVTMGAGDIWKVADEYIQWLRTDS
jgi:UDP-N-acetylmuramate--alanine ligase